MKLRKVLDKGDPNNKKIAYDFFVKEKGYSPEVALGIIGNLMQESYSNLVTTSVGFDGTGSFGIAQWLGSRKKKLKQIRPDDYSTLKGQLEFIDWELNNTEKRAAEKLKEATTIEDAALIFSKYYERPHKDYAHNDKRVNYATSLGKELGVITGESSKRKGYNIEYPTVAIDNTRVVKPRLPKLATPPINPTYAALPEDKVAKEKTITEKDLREILQKEKQSIEQSFLKKYQQILNKQNSQEQQEIKPQQPQQDLSYLYNYIDQNYNYINQQDDSFYTQFELGGELDDNCGGPGQPPCKERREVAIDNTRTKRPIIFKNIPKNIKQSTANISIDDILNDEPTIDKVNIPYRETQDDDCNNYYGCVAGGIKDMARTLKTSEEKLRKKSNLYGDAWDIIDNSYGQDIDISKNYSNVRVGDMVSLSRDPLKKDKEKGIPDKEQHFSYVSKIVNGKPYVRHYINSTNDYYEEPIDNIKQFLKYKPSRVKRPDAFKDIEMNDENYTTPFFNSSPQEHKIIESINKDSETLQKVLRLNSDEYTRLSKLAYGIIGAETDFGQSKRTVFRMTAPDFIIKQIQKQRGNYNKDYNPISQGYSSIKESSLYDISDNRDIDIKEIQEKVGLKGKDIDGIWGNQTQKAVNNYNKNNPNSLIKYKTLLNKLDDLDYKDLSKTKNYIPVVMAELGFDIEDLEDPANAYKATMSILAKNLKSNSNMSNEQLLKKYTGKKDIKQYKNKVNNYKNNFDDNAENDVQPEFVDKIYGYLSNTSNFTNSKIKNLKSVVVESLFNNSKTIPINFRAIASSTTGADFTITEEALSSKSINKLKNIIKTNVSKGKFNIEYGDYGNDRLADVGGKSSKSTIEKIKQAMTDEGTVLKQFLGQASIKKVEEGVYEITDTYDFNNKGESFGVIDDVRKKGLSPYTVVRSIGTNYGKGDGLGNKVKIRINLNE